MILIPCSDQECACGFIHYHNSPLCHLRCILKTFQSYCRICSYSPYLVGLLMDLTWKGITSPPPNSLLLWSTTDFICCPTCSSKGCSQQSVYGAMCWQELLQPILALSFCSPHQIKECLLEIIAICVMVDYTISMSTDGEVYFTAGKKHCYGCWHGATSALILLWGHFSFPL